MYTAFKDLWNRNTLSFLLLTGFLIRLLAVVFSKGYGWHDDHFLVIESSQSWVDHYDYNGWLPKAANGPSGHSFFYAGLHYLLFSAMKFFGIADPQAKMFLIRLLHALYSLLIIYYGYKIVQKLTDNKTAEFAGLLLSVLWFMPFLSVRNLVEFVCVVPLMAGTWLLIKNNGQKLKLVFFAGLITGIAFSLRFQTILFAAGIGAAFIFLKRFRELFVFGLAYLLCILIVQGGIDYFVWGKPFVEFTEYVNYNVDHAGEYGGMSWYNYFFVIFGIFIPPLSFMLVFGYVRSFRKYLLLSLPAFIFLIFHVYFKNRQERFIIPAFPFLIMAGTIGWFGFLKNSSFWKRNSNLLKSGMIFFWILNFILIIPITLNYSKRDRVEAMLYLSRKTDFKQYLVEDSQREMEIMFPAFYLGKWTYGWHITSNSNREEVLQRIAGMNSPETPNYVLFLQKENLQERIAYVKKFFPGMIFETTIEPSFIDYFLNKINPRNRNQTCTVYKLRN